MAKREALGIGGPQNVIADAGYGYRNNYDYLEHHGMGAYIKYPGYWTENKNSAQTRYKGTSKKPYFVFGLIFFLAAALSKCSTKPSYAPLLPPCIKKKSLRQIPKTVF